jgi:hypothetical protein
MQITFELHKMVQMPRTTIDTEVWEILRKRAWFIPSPMILEDQAIEHEFFICVDEIDDISRDEDQPVHIREYAAQLYDSLPDVTYVQVIDQ